VRWNTSEHWSSSPRALRCSRFVRGHVGRGAHTPTHAGMSREERLAAGITDGLVRYSVGIEDVEELLADLKRTLGDDGAQGPCLDKS